MDVTRSSLANRLHTDEIPDKTYKVTIHQSYPKYYAVLFDNPNDGKKVAMMHTWFTRNIGRDRPDEYLDRFRKRIKFYRNFRISEEHGTVRGYLVISDLLDHIAYKDRSGDKIIIQIIDPHLRARDPS